MFVNSITAGLIVEDRELQAELQRCLEELSIRVVLEQTDPGADWSQLLDRIERVRPDVILLEIARLRQPLDEAVQLLRSTAAAPVVFALHTAADPEKILAVLRAGASEYLFPPLEGPLKAALSKVASARQQADDASRRGGKVAAFVSAKGGCGATTLACHVAVEIPRLAKGKVLLADFDFQSGIIGFLLKSKTPYSVADAAHNLQRLDVSYWKALISNGIPNLEVIRAPISARDKEISGAHVREILRFARAHYDHSVVDLGRNLTATSLAALEASDEAYLVTTAEVPALHEAQQIIRQLLETGYPQTKLHIVLNRLSRRMEVSLDELGSMLGMPVFATVVNDYHSLDEAYSEGRLVDPGSSAGQSFAKLAAKVAGVEPEKKKKFSLFG